MLNRKHETLGFLGTLVACALLSCGVEPSDDPGTGGSSGSGGSAGAVAGSGGGTAGTGAPAAGTSSAGNASSGSGGAGGSGGSAGSLGSGGTSGKGPGTGGASAGGAPSAGSSAGGNGPVAGSSAAGSSGSGGSGAGSGGSGSVSKGAGCGASDPLESGRASIDVSGTMREYVLDVPEDYDADRPYKLVFGWHWRGGTANDVVSGNIIGGAYYGLKQRAQGSAIFVSPEGIDNGWANTGGRDIAFLKAMLELFDSKLCIDHERIFSTGFSYGGMMSNAIGCEMADVFRAIAPMSGALYSGCRQANDHPIAVWMAHGENDTVVPLSDGEAALETFLERNGCQSQSSPVEPSPCVAYSGCADGYPVHYCKFSGGHSPQNWAPAALWDFFSQF